MLHGYMKCRRVPCDGTTQFHSTANRGLHLAAAKIYRLFPFSVTFQRLNTQLLLNQVLNAGAMFHKVPPRPRILTVNVQCG